MVDPTDDEIAAALVAIQLYLDAEQPHELPSLPVERWRMAARLEAQGAMPGRSLAPHWGNVERLRRAGR